MSTMSDDEKAAREWLMKCGYHTIIKHPRTGEELERVPTEHYVDVFLAGCKYKEEQLAKGAPSFEAYCDLIEAQGSCLKDGWEGHEETWNGCAVYLSAHYAAEEKRKAERIGRLEERLGLLSSFTGVSISDSLDFSGWEPIDRIEALGFYEAYLPEGEERDSLEITDYVARAAIKADDEIKGKT